MPPTAKKRTKKSLTLKQTRFIESYLKSRGHIGNACRDACIGRTLYYEWMKDDYFLMCFDHAKEEFNDSIQSRIVKLAELDDRDMIKFWAKTQMKHRGFVEKQEIEVSGNFTDEFVGRLNAIYNDSKSGETSRKS